MIITTSGWILLVALGFFLTSGGALVSSLLNRRKLEHMHRNMRAMRQGQEAMEGKALVAAKEIKQALDVQQAKLLQGTDEVKHVLEVQQAKDDARHASPTDVTIVNNPAQAVPVENVNGVKDD